MTELLTPRQVALAIGVSEASIKRWCDKGVLPMVRTAGGHRRLATSSVMRFLRESGRAAVRPEVLGLPSIAGRGEPTLGRACRRFREILEAGDEEAARRTVLDLYLAGHPTHVIFDRVIAPAFHEIGDRWGHGETEVYQEHRAVEVCARALLALRDALAPATGPKAIGGTLEGDPYTLAGVMAEVVLRENGWSSQFIGPAHPTATLCEAIREVRPKLFYLSHSPPMPLETLVGSYSPIYKVAIECGCAVVVGGRALTPEIRAALEFSSCADNMAHLVGYVRSLQPREG